jgi:hypothetical protein
MKEVEEEEEKDIKDEREKQRHHPGADLFLKIYISTYVLVRLVERERLICKGRRTFGRKYSKWWQRITF